MRCCREMELRVPSDMIYLRPVRAFVKELAESRGFCPEKANDIGLAVDEILTNAIEHGSDDAGSPIMIQCLSTSKMMKIVISDAGRQEVASAGWPDAWADAIGEKTKSGTERGHGLLLAHNLADEMSMESNPTGGVDVNLVIYKEGQQIAQ